jgi:hypothetical protein
MSRTSTKGLAPGVRVHRKSNATNSSEDGTFIRSEEHPTRGTIVWYRPDKVWTTRSAPLADIRILRRPRNTRALTEEEYE